MEFAYTVKRSRKRKKLTITVERDKSVVVHAPFELPDDRIGEILESKKAWVFEKLTHSQKYSDLPHPPGKELVNGESALYLGKLYRIELVEQLEEICFSNRFLIPSSQQHQRKTVLKNWYIAKAKEKLLPKAVGHAKELGVNFNHIKIVDNRYRWGSCTPRNNVNLNWRLIKAPMFTVDYVIVHELAHLLEANHTANFWSIVRTHTPKMEKARSWLKENGQILEEDI
ncbi:WLM domain protein [Anaerohalosphaera lusitana]|uniref:WLM domain protein n=1 Tax=Anaerohalosphaera lusitana TaxID=1936003 RepID=A0A1U9NJ01_9BACT|nr:SprT family zinc-dependent metalloprotease [Anaerohalosphaera lusitana]AQT67912.1 WLM domain protein [Anaerohalosphaera lusitana]